MADRLPLTLRAYRLLTALAVPFADHGARSSPQARQGARRAAAGAARRKLHRASRRAAGLAARRQRRRDAVDPAADRPHPRARHHRAGDVGHGDRRRTGRAAVAAGRDPSIRAARRAAIRRALPRSLAARPRAVRRIRSVAQPDHGGRRARHSADPGQRPRVGALVPALAARAAHDRQRLLGRFDLCLAQSAEDAARYAELGAPRYRHDRQSQARRAGAAGRSDASSGSSRPPSARAR